MSSDGKGMEVLDAAREIKRFCENAGGKYGFYADYSGRMMFGKECVGVVCKDAVQAAADLAGYLSGSGLSLGRACRDGMGKGEILYFPDIAWEGETLSEGLVRFCAESGGRYTLHRDYPSRTLNGRKCTGVSCDSFVEMFAEFTAFANENELIVEGVETDGATAEETEDGKLMAIFPFMEL